MISANAFHAKLLSRGIKCTYVKVQHVLKGGGHVLSIKERREFLSVLDDLYKETKENILKS